MDLPVASTLFVSALIAVIAAMIVTVDHSRRGWAVAVGAIVVGTTHVILTKWAFSYALITGCHEDSVVPVVWSGLEGIWCQGENGRRLLGFGIPIVSVLAFTVCAVAIARRVERFVRSRRERAR